MSCFRVNSRHTFVDKGSLGIEIHSFILDVPQEDRQLAATPVVVTRPSVVSVPSLALHDKLIEISTQTSVNHEADIHLDSITEFRLELQGGGKRNEEVNHLDQNTAAC